MSPQTPLTQGPTARRWAAARGVPPRHSMALRGRVPIGSGSPAANSPSSPRHQAPGCAAGHLQALQRRVARPASRAPPPVPPRSVIHRAQPAKAVRAGGGAGAAAAAAAAAAATARAAKLGRLMRAYCCLGVGRSGLGRRGGEVLGGGRQLRRSAVSGAPARPVAHAQSTARHAGPCCAQQAAPRQLCTAAPVASPPRMSAPQRRHTPCQGGKGQRQGERRRRRPMCSPPLSTAPAARPLPATAPQRRPQAASAGKCGAGKPARCDGEFWSWRGRRRPSRGAVRAPALSAHSSRARAPNRPPQAHNKRRRAHHAPLKPPQHTKDPPLPAVPPAQRGQPACCAVGLALFRAGGRRRQRLRCQEAVGRAASRQPFDFGLVLGLVEVGLQPRALAWVAWVCLVDRGRVFCLCCARGRAMGRWPALRLRPVRGSCRDQELVPTLRQKQTPALRDAPPPRPAHVWGTAPAAGLAGSGTRPRRAAALRGNAAGGPRAAARSGSAQQQRAAAAAPATRPRSAMQLGPSATPSARWL